MLFRSPCSNFQTWSLLLVMKICDDIYKSFMTPKFMMRQVLAIRTPEDFAFLFKAGKAVIGHIMDFKRDKK